MTDVLPSRALADIVDNSAALVYVKSPDGRYVLINRHFERRFGMPREEVLGKTDFELFSPAAAARYTAHDRQVLATGESIEVEEPAEDTDEEGRYLSIKFPLFDESGRPYALGGISTDISDRKRAEAAAREAKEEAERANRAKSEFLSRVSHELRTPLNSIIGYGQLLELEDLTPDATAGVDRILSAGRHLLALINEVLELSRIEAGGHHVALEPVHACDPLKEALELVGPLARDRGIELQADVHAGLHRFVLADYQKLKQVLLNILTNGVKYNRERGIVRVYFRRRGKRLRFVTVDTGPGIAPPDLSRLFLPFERLAAAGTDTEGTGLGLALSKSLIEAMGGEIGVQHSAPGEGTAFFVELPLTDERAPEAATPPAAPLMELGPATVLYVEDNLSNLDLVQRILARAGEVELIPAMQGQLGLELATRHDIDLILLDLHLPDMAGASVLRRLKEDPRTRDIPVVVLSADATPKQIERLRRAGIADYLTKPLDIGGFVGALRRALDG